MRRHAGPAGEGGFGEGRGLLFSFRGWAMLEGIGCVLRGRCMWEGLEMELSYEAGWELRSRQGCAKGTPKP